MRARFESYNDPLPSTNQGTSLKNGITLLSVCFVQHHHFSLCFCLCFVVDQQDICSIISDPHSTLLSVAIIILTWKLFCFAKYWEERTDLQTTCVKIVITTVVKEGRPSWEFSENLKLQSTQIARSRQWSTRLEHSPGDSRLNMIFWDGRTACVKIVVTNGRDCGNGLVGQYSQELHLWFLDLIIVTCLLILFVPEFVLSCGIFPKFPSILWVISLSILLCHRDRVYF